MARSSCAAAFGDQVEARIAFARRCGGGGRGQYASARSRSSESFEPRPSSSMALRYRLRVAKSMAAKSARSVQRFVDEADAFEELRPVDVRHQPHAGDDVAHRDVRGALAQVLFLQQAVRSWSSCSASSFSSHSSAGVTFGSWSRSRCTSCTAKAGVSAVRLAAPGAQRVRIDALAVDAEQPVGDRVGFLARERGS